MKFTLILLSMIVTGEAIAAACREIPSGNRALGNKKAQTLRALTGKDTGKRSDEAYLGEDLVYEGAPCPAGKICVETLFNNRQGTSVNLHGQVIVINKSNGAVETLAPLRFKDQNGARGQSINERGIAPFDQKRWRDVCNGIKNFGATVFRDPNPPGAGVLAAVAQCEGRPTDPPRDPNPVLDIYSYHNTSISLPDTAGSPFSGIYRSFSQGAKARTIEYLNSGNITKSGEYTQAGSVQYGGQATVGRVARIVGDVRKALGCEPEATNPRVRISSNLVDQAQEFSACGISIVNGPSQKRIVLNGSRAIDLREDVPRPEPKKKRKKDAIIFNTTVNTENLFDIPFPCTTVQESPVVEVVTCENGPVAPVNPAAQEYERDSETSAGNLKGGRYNPQVKIIARIVNGRIEKLESQKNFTYYQDLKSECTPVPAEGSSRPRTNTGGSTVEGQ